MEQFHAVLLTGIDLLSPIRVRSGTGYFNGLLQFLPRKEANISPLSRNQQLMKWNIYYTLITRFLVVFLSSLECLHTSPRVANLLFLHPSTYMYLKPFSTVVNGPGSAFELPLLEAALYKLISTIKYNCLLNFLRLWSS